MKRKILVSLDCMLDTRLGVLATINQEHLKVVLNDPRGQYFSRVVDDFDWIEKGLTAKFKEAYAARKDPQILANSFKTNIVGYLRQLVIALLVSADEDPVWNDVGFDINYWPYDLTITQLGFFKQVLTEALGGEGTYAIEPNVRMVNIPLEELTIERIGRDWNAVYLYDFAQWTDLIHKSLDGKEMKAVNTEMHVPALFRELPDRKSLRQKDGTALNPFYETKRNMALWINLNFISPVMYSIPDPRAVKPPKSKT